jgi:hypothetical protein
MPLSFLLDFAWWGLLVVGYFTFSESGDLSWLLIPTGGWAGLILGLITLQSLLVLVAAIRNGPKDFGYYVLAALSVLVIGSAMQVYPLPDPNHIYWALAPGFGVFVYFCWCSSRAGVWVCGLFLLLLLLPTGYSKYNEARYTLSQPLVKLVEPPAIRGMRVNLAQAQAFKRIDAVLQPLFALKPDRLGVLYGSDALYLTWLTKRINPSPYYVNWGGLLPRMDQLRRLIFLEQQQPVLFLHEYRLGAHENGEMVELLHAVNYRIIHREPELSLFIALPIDPTQPTSTP